MFALFPFLIRKPKPADQEIERFILKRFGHRVRSIAHFNLALTHKSLINSPQDQSNERLEFLGDTVLDAVVAELLYNRFPDYDEGSLTKIKSKIVNRETLSSIAIGMEIDQILKYNKNRSIKLDSIAGNAFEALVGAIYLDGGFEAVRNSLNRYVFRIYIDLNHLLEEEIDFKSRLFIWSQKQRVAIQFQVIEEENLGSEWLYRVSVVMNQKDFGMGTGTSKKRAEQAAAKQTLELLGEI